MAACSSSCTSSTRPYGSPRSTPPAGRPTSRRLDFAPRGRPPVRAGRARPRRGAARAIRRVLLDHPGRDGAMMPASSARSVTLEDGPRLRLERRLEHPIQRVCERSASPTSYAIGSRPAKSCRSPKAIRPSSSPAPGSATRCASSCGPKATAACSCSRTPSPSDTAARDGRRLGALPRAPGRAVRRRADERGRVARGRARPCTSATPRPSRGPTSSAAAPYAQHPQT